MLQALIGTARVPFLILAPLCVSVALAYAVFLGLTVSLLDVVLCYLAALAAHASVNMFNECHDHLSGLDHITQRTPFSGGSGTLQRFPEQVDNVRKAAWALLLLSAIIGLYFVFKQGYLLLVIGLVAAASVLLYTPKINRMPLVCLLAPGFGFGVAFVVGSFVALTGVLDGGILLAMLPVFLLTNNLLLLNQFPDEQADRQSGREHLIIRYGLRAGQLVYLANLLLVAAASAWLAVRLNFSSAGLLLFVPVVLGCISLFGLGKFVQSRQLPAFQPFLAANVVATLSYPTIVTGILAVSRFQ